MNIIDSEMPNPTSKPNPCAQCGREERYCVCELATPIQVKTKLLILQHPQEPGVDIGTVPIVISTFPDTQVKTGLSWPNLSKILGRQVDNKRWGVLYMGSVHMSELPPGRNLFVVDRKGKLLENQKAILDKLEGIVILDGTWSQAKTLWWRNAWLLKLPRLVLRPTRNSLYDRIRKEPRTGCVSTAEAVGDVIDLLERRSDALNAVDKPLVELVTRLARYRPVRGGGARQRSARRSRRVRGDR